MSEIVRNASPSGGDKSTHEYKPDELNADLAAASMAKELINKWPKPAIDTRKFTIIHGLMQSMNHTVENRTYIDSSLLIELMDRVSEKSVNVDGKLFNSVFAYLMHPKYIIQGMPQVGTGIDENKPGFLSRLWGGITGKGQSQESNKT